MTFIRETVSITNKYQLATPVLGEYKTKVEPAVWKPKLILHIMI